MRELKTLTGRTVVVASDGATLRGVLESATRSFVTLVEVVAVDRPQQTPIAGSVLVPVPRISYVQVVS